MKKKFRNRKLSGNFFDLPSALQKKVIMKAVRESTKMQLEVFKKAGISLSKIKV